MTERKDVVTFKGQPLTLEGVTIKVGDPAPNFIATATDLEQVEFNRYRGKPTVLLSVPSLDTDVCDTEIRRFNEEAAKLEGVTILVLSMDLPFAQKRWCGAAGADRVKTLSDHKDAAFGRAYGVLIKELRLLARAAFVVSPDHHVRYIQIVPELSNEPDYGAILEAVRKVS